jgi:hypothetical protein
MGTLRDTNLLSVVFKLMDRGLSGDQIDRAMRQMVGNDWREVQVSIWFNRLQEKDLIIHNDEDRFIDDLEALVIGKIKLDELCRRG